MKANKENLENELERIIKQLKRLGAKKIILFGSLANGNIRLSSDIDLIAVFDDNKNFKERMKEVYTNIDSREGVDILVYNFEEFEKVKHRPFFKYALSQGREIYGE